MSNAINDPVVAAEVAALHEQYEDALVSNDVERLIGFFWDSNLAVRFGVGESLYGAEEIAEFRRNRSPIDLNRAYSNVRITTFGSDTAVVTLEFHRKSLGLTRQGRQTQVWRKFEQGWKVVSAHVSFTPAPYLDHAAALIGLPIPEQYREGVRLNLERTATIARSLLEYPISESTESAPVFEP